MKNHSYAKVYYVTYYNPIDVNINTLIISILEFFFRDENSFHRTWENLIYYYDVEKNFLTENIIAPVNY